MFADIGNGMGFDEAFEIHMGLTLEYYEAHFWELMEAFLPRRCHGAGIDWNAAEWEREFEVFR